MTAAASTVRTFWSLAVADAMTGPRIVDVAPLAGGNYARSWLITLDRPPHALVGRRLPSGSSTSVATVNQLLERCNSAGVPSPTPVWSRGSPGSGVQSQLITWIDGGTTPPEHAVEVSRLAEAVVRIAMIDSGGLQLPAFPPLPSPRWQNRIRRSALGSAALDRLLSLPPPALEGGLIHGDLCGANVLWNDDELAGIIDWDRASRGPFAVDVAMLWSDLLIRHGVVVAQSFLSCVAETELDLDDLRYWQLRMVTSSLGGEIDVRARSRLARAFGHLSA